jgi:hypothetical protein
MSAAASQKKVHIDSRLSGIALFFAAAAVYFAAVQVNVRLRTMGASWVEPPLQERMKWNPTLVKALSFGQWPMVVDMLWIRALQDPSLSHVPEGTHAPIFHDFDLATELDPAFAEVYIYGANMLVIIRNDKYGAAELLTKGEKFRKEELPHYPKEFFERYWRRGWWVPLTLGYTYLYELNDVARAARAFTEAAKMDGVPEHIRSLGTRLLTVEGQYDVALSLLDMLIQQQKDERVAEGLEKRKRNLLLSKYLYDLNSDFMEYLQKQPDYRKSLSVSREGMQKFWLRFRKETVTPATDPLGGVLSVNEQGKVVSSTPREKAFGLD